MRKQIGFSLLLAGIACAETAPEIPYTSDEPGSGWWQIVSSPTNYLWDNGEKDEPVDFTIFQDDFDNWQLIACVRRTKFPTKNKPQGGAGRVLFQWESDDFFATDWKQVGVLLTPDELAGNSAKAYGLLQAPHMVTKENGVYYMIFNGSEAHMMTSPNGRDWTQVPTAAGDYNFFNMGRDVMVFDNRDVDGLWYAMYTFDKYNPNEFKVKYRTAKHLLGPWSNPADYLREDPKTDRNVESPFMVKRDKWYYLFVNGAVYAQTSITNQFADPKLTDPGVYGDGGTAPEIIHVDGKDYIAGYGVGTNIGIRIRPLHWSSVDALKK